MISYEPETGVSVPNSVPFNGHSYRIIEEDLTWQEAKIYCEGLGGHLADILSQEEEDFIDSLIDADTQYHIGGYQTDDGLWHWVTDQPWEYTNWQPGQPNDTSRYLCYWNDGTKKWHDSNIGTACHFICEWDWVDIPVPVAPSCESIRRGLNLSYYLESNIKGKE